MERQGNTNQGRILQIVLLINFIFFIVEMTGGLLSRSMGLVADSLDMLADAFVYGLSLLAVGKTLRTKKNVAKIAGILQFILAIAGISEVVRRFIEGEKMPDFRTMIIISLFSLAANALCLYLLKKARSNEAHIKASMIFTSNDVLINIGVILAGTLVYFLNSGIPDLVIGSVVFLIVFRSSIKIYKLGTDEEIAND